MPTKKPASSTKKAAVKRKPVAKKIAKTKKTTAKAAETRGRGRPKGALTHQAEGFEFRRADSYARKNAIEKQPGLRRVTIQIDTPERAVKLEKLCNLLKSEDVRLMKLLK